MKKILLIEDEEKINNMIYDFFTFNGFKVIRAFDGLQGITKFLNEPNVDLVILDVMLPNIDGFTVLNKIRKKSNVPVIMVTARSEQDDILMGYEFKVDDYITKPFNLEILLAKVNVILNRITNLTNSIASLESTDIIDINGIKINMLQFKVYVENKEIQLERKQFEILQYLMKNRNIVISRENILENIWGYDYYGSIRVVDSQIKKLRKNLNSKAYLIKTVFGVGYKFDTE